MLNNWKMFYLTIEIGRSRLLFFLIYQIRIFSWHKGKCPTQIYFYFNLAITAFQSCETHSLSCLLVDNKKAKSFCSPTRSDTFVMNRARGNFSCLTLFAQINKPNPFSKRTKRCFLLCVAAPRWGSGHLSAPCDGNFTIPVFFTDNLRLVCQWTSHRSILTLYYFSFVCFSENSSFSK